MTQQQKTIKLAEWSGDWIIKDWKESEDWYSIIVEDKNGRICEFKNNGYAKELQFIDLPEFFEDLNAVQKLKKKLSFNQQTEFVANLMRAKKDFPMTEAFFAEADEQCETLGKTLNLW